MITTRFAPSPTGLLHLGHAYAALVAYEAAKREGGRFLLRIEDIDPVRCHPDFTQGILEDLKWLGLTWEEPVRVQSEHLQNYAAALERLKGMGLLYPCFCTRREVAAEAEAAGAAPHAGIDEPVYAGTCRFFSKGEQKERQQERLPVWRLDMQKAVKIAWPFVWMDQEKGVVNARPERFGDVVLARRDVATSYHLSVTVDDALQGVTLVTRGDDLFSVTDIHVLLQKLLGYETPTYLHHGLLTDETGKRYAKRDKAVTLQSLRAAGVSAKEIRARVGF